MSSPLPLATHLFLLAVSVLAVSWLARRLSPKPGLHIPLSVTTSE